MAEIVITVDGPPVAVPPGAVAMVVTDLVMDAPPAPDAAVTPDGFALVRVPVPGLAWYRTLFSRVGAEWLWESRLAMPDAVLREILVTPGVEVYALTDDGTDIGLLELDFRAEGLCNLAYFGIVAGRTGQGAGRWMMARALALAWRENVARVRVNTCTLDHPAALAFYIRAGFRPVGQRVEVFTDPRLRGLVPKEAAPRIALREP